MLIEEMACLRFASIMISLRVWEGKLLMEGAGFLLGNICTRDVSQNYKKAKNIRHRSKKYTNVINATNSEHCSTSYLEESPVTLVYNFIRYFRMLLLPQVRNLFQVEF